MLARPLVDNGSASVSVASRTLLTQSLSFGSASAADTDNRVSLRSSGKYHRLRMQPTDQYRGDFEDANPGLNANNSPAINIPEINVQMKSSAIVAKTRKLKAVWTPEFAQDLNAY